MEKSIEGGMATVRFEHSAKIDMADLVETRLAGKFSVKDLGTGKLTLMAK